MAQIEVTLEQVQHRSQRKHNFTPPISTTIGIGDSYTITPNGTGSVLLDTLSDTEYTVSEAPDVVAGLIADQTSRDDYYKRVANGEVAGQRIMRGLGERESIGTTATGEDIWRGNELSATPAAPTSTTKIPIPASAGEQMSIISESVLDNGSGVTGALTVTIEYLDATGMEQTTVATMNGTTAVDLTPSDVRFINDMYVTTVGALGVAAGHIRVYNKATPGLVYNMIALGGNKSLVPHRMIPFGKKLVIKEWSASEGNNKRITIRLRADCNNAVPPVRQAGVFLFKSVLYLNQTANQMPLAYNVPALSIVKVSGWAIALNAEVGVHWWGVLIDE